MQVLIIFHTKEPQGPELFDLRVSDEFTAFLERMKALHASKAKIAVYKLGECVGDFS